MVTQLEGTDRALYLWIIDNHPFFHKFSFRLQPWPTQSFLKNVFVIDWNVVFSLLWPKPGYEKKHRAIFKAYIPLLVSATKPGQNHLSEAAGPVKFGLTFRPLDGTLQPSIEKTLKVQTEQKYIWFVKGKHTSGRITFTFCTSSLPWGWERKPVFFYLKDKTCVGTVYLLHFTHRLSEGLWGRIGRSFHAWLSCRGKTCPAWLVCEERLPNIRKSE